MKVKTICLITVIWVCSFNTVLAQIRSDFVLVEAGNDPDIVVDEQGRLHAVWWNSSGTYYGLYDSLLELIKAPRLIDEDSGDDTVLDVRSDFVVVAWQAIPATFNDLIFGRLLNPEADSISSRLIFNDDYSDALRFEPDVAFMDDTTFVVLWAGEGFERPFSPGVYAQRTSTCLEFIGPNQLLSDDRARENDQFSPHIATHAESDQFVVVWGEAFSDSHNELFGRLFSKNGVPKDSTFLISVEPDTPFVRNTDVVMNGNGDFIAVWSSGRSVTGVSIYMRHFNAEGIPLGECKQINEDLLVPTTEVAISIDGSGCLVVVWERKNSQGSNIVAQRFADDGSRIGNNFQVSATVDTLRHLRPTVALKDGKIYTVWNTLKAANSINFILWANILDFDNPAVGVEQQPEQAPVSFRLLQNYPNPFNPATTIRFEVAQQAQVQLAVYNILGEEIITLVNEEVMPGSHDAVWDGKDDRGKDVSSGIYLYKLNIAGRTEIKKMILVR